MHVRENGSIENDGNYMTLNGRQGMGNLGAMAVYDPVSRRERGKDLVVNRNDPGFRRPFIHPKFNKPWVRVDSGRTVFEKGEPRMAREEFPVALVCNEWGISNEALMTANATSLPPLIWRQIDQAVIKEPQRVPRAWADLVAANPVGGFDAYASSTYETQVMSDFGEAVMSMDLRNEDYRNDSQKLGLHSVPLPITSSGFNVSDRQLAISRKGGRDTAFDVSGGEMAGLRIAQMVEKRTIGLGQSFTFGTQTAGVTAHTGTSTVWGYLDFPYATATTSFTQGSAGGWTPETFVNELLAAIETLTLDSYPGPFIVYHSTDWSQYLNKDYWAGTAAAGMSTPTRTLKERLRQIDQIQDIRRLDFLDATANPFTIILVDMSGKSARAINGRGITTIQYATKGGTEINFIVYCIWVPLMLSTYSGRTGILIGT